MWRDGQVALNVELFELFCIVLDKQSNSQFVGYLEIAVWMVRESIFFLARESRTQKETKDQEEISQYELVQTI